MIDLFSWLTNIDKTYPQFRWRSIRPAASAHSSSVTELRWAEYFPNIQIARVHAVDNSTMSSAAFTFKFTFFSFFHKEPKQRMTDFFSGLTNNFDRQIRQFSTALSAVNTHTSKNEHSSISRFKSKHFVNDFHPLFMILSTVFWPGQKN